MNLTPQFLEKAKGWPRKLGRYNASDLYKMLESGTIPWGLKPEDYFKIQDADFESAMRMKMGVLYHELVQGLLDPAKCENKKEYYYDPFVVVGKADYLPDEHAVWEIKTSDKVMGKSRAWHDHQAKLYCTMFERPVGLIMQPLIEDDQLVLREVGRVERDDDWFENEMQRLKNYHERIQLIHEEYAVHQ